MKLLNKKSLLLMIIISLLVIFTACSDDKVKNENDTDKNTVVNNDEVNNNNGNEVEVAEEGIDEPVTLKVALNIGEEGFISQYKEPVEEHFTNVTVELVPFAPDREAIEEELMAGIIPDIIQGNNLENLTLFNEYDLLLDQTPFIEKYNFNIDLFNSSFLQAIRSYADGEELWALPKDMTRYALHYNQDIFDRFGVDYPTDDMTWQEVIDLSKQVTGTQSGHDYVGLQLPVPRILLSTLSTPLVDSETDEPLFTKKDEFTELFKLYESVYDNSGPQPNLVANGQFIGEKNLAMVPIFYLYSDWTGLKEATEEGMGWDIASFPVWDKNEPYTPMVGGQWLAVTDFSEHQDAAFQVMKFWLDRDEIGTILEGPVSVPYSSQATGEFIDEVGLDEDIQDKNTDALFNHPTLDKQEKLSKYETVVYPVLVNAVNEFISEEDGARKDINTVLRELQESAEIAIEEEKAQE